MTGHTTSVLRYASTQECAVAAHKTFNLGCTGVPDHRGTANKHDTEAYRCVAVRPPIATTVVCHVNVVSNRLGDEGLHILCEVITQGTCALRSFNAERNRITLKVFSSILMHFFLF